MVGKSPLRKEIEIDGVVLCISEWARKMGIDRAIIKKRINSYGWSPRDAVMTPVGVKRGK